MRYESMIAEGVPVTIRAHLRQLGLPSNLSDVMKLTQQARSHLPFEIAPPLHLPRTSHLALGTAAARRDAQAEADGGGRGQDRHDAWARDDGHHRPGRPRCLPRARQLLLLVLQPHAGAAAHRAGVGPLADLSGLRGAVRPSVPPLQHDGGRVAAAGDADGAAAAGLARRGARFALPAQLALGGFARGIGRVGLLEPSHCP